MTRNVSILIVEDDHRVSEYLAQTLAGAAWCASLECASDLGQAHQALERGQFQLAFVDIGLPDGSGLEVIARITREVPSAQSIVITVFNDETTVLNAIRVGASSYLLKDALPEDIISVAGDVLSGRSHISAGIAHHLITELQKDSEDSETIDRAPITRREKEVLDCIARGYSSDQVAELLEVSYHTVASHIKNIYKKLQVSSRSEAIYEAHKQGIIKF